MSRNPGATSHDPFSRSLPSRTPGSLGQNDAGDPRANANLGEPRSTYLVSGPSGRNQQCLPSEAECS
jgi:hypothetical protein